MLAKPYSDLFVYKNYRFSTRDKGRQTSLYFQDAEGNQGRWRREHPDGELLIWQGKSIRIYISQNHIGQYNPNIALQVYRALKDGLSRHQNYSTIPTDGWHIIEMVPPTFYVGHCSSGQIILRDPTAGAANYTGLANYAGAIADWSLRQN